YPNFFSAKQRLWHRLVNARKLLRRATAVIAVSAHTKTDIVEMFGVPDDRISVISPAVSPEFRPQNEEAAGAIRAKFGLKKPFFLLFYDLV
ncbi:MAG: glycosyltransferase, partial [Desulfatitalea sp.]|nr:glycosyltransferase [Desulfatitalea sp.]